jgi:hypothetical protein
MAEAVTNVAAFGAFVDFGVHAIGWRLMQL